MKAVVKKASDYNYIKLIEIKTIDDLLKIYKSIIIETNEIDLRLYKERFGKYDMVITIYDDYVE